MASPSIYDIHGIGPVRGHHLFQAGYHTPEAIATASLDELTDVPYITERNAPQIQSKAQEYIDEIQRKKQEYLDTDDSGDC